MSAMAYETILVEMRVLAQFAIDRLHERGNLNCPRKDWTPLAKCSGRESGKARGAGRSERAAGQPGCEAIEVDGRSGRYVLQARLGEPAVACLAQAERTPCEIVPSTPWRWA